MSDKSKEEFIARIVHELRRGGEWTRQELKVLLDGYFDVETSQRLDSLYLCMAQARMKALKWCLDMVQSDAAQKRRSYAESAIQAQIDDLREIIHTRLKEQKAAAASYDKWSDEMSKSFVEWQANTVEPNLHYSDTISNDLKPYIQHIMAQLPHVASASLSEDSALSDFCPPDEDMDDWLTQMSKKFGLQLERGNTLLTDVARDLQANDSGKFDKKTN